MSVESETVDKGEDGEVSSWLQQIEMAKKSEKLWLTDAEHAIKVYRNDQRVVDTDNRKETFNILWSNIETKRPALYNSMPTPDIRRRHKDKDKLGKVISEICERSASYIIDCQSFDDIMIAAVNDMLLPGRAITRVRYVPTMQDMEQPEPAEGEEAKEPDQEVTYEEVQYEQVQYKDFGRGPGSSWDEVTYIWFNHRLTKDQIEDKFPDFKDLVQYDVMADGEEKGETDKTDATIFNRCLVHEVWDKEHKEVLFIAPSYKDKALKKESDPLGLSGFWPIPKPLYAIESSTSLVPVTEYSMYETLAKELETATNKIKNVLDGVRVRGIFDSTITEMKKLFESNNNEFIPAENLSRLIETGGLDKAIWTLPVEMYAAVLIQLYQYRDSLIRQIYEITGISDVMRGNTDPGETLGAQEIKASFGSQRIQKQQAAVQRYARDLIRMTVEVVANNFKDETISLMTGLEFPTGEEKQQAQMIMQQLQQQAQMTGQPPQVPPQLMEILSKPSWDEINKVFRSDVSREFRIDIETDSTIQAEQQKDQKSLAELMAGMGQFFQAIVPAIQLQFVSPEAAKQLTMAMVRRFRLGKHVEDAFDSQPAQQPPNPEQQAQKQEAQKAQVEMQAMQQEMQIKQQLSQMQAQIEQERIMAERENNAMKSQLEREKMNADLMKTRNAMQLDRAKFEQQMLQMQVGDGVTQ